MSAAAVVAAEGLFGFVMAAEYMKAAGMFGLGSAFGKAAALGGCVRAFTQVGTLAEITSRRGCVWRGRPNGIFRS
jgi:hypothetical protein